jgi:cell fate (sporulation/competence/biofilm development) regulator YmcA (YheA/YmcA/DUF963 family)
MESKEKAKELVDRFRNVDYLKDYEGMDEELAQQCAIIAVDEIINSRPAITDSQVDYQDYWRQVKQEIENL